MANAYDERYPYTNGEAGEKFRKRHFLPEIHEEPQNISHEASQNVSCLSTHQCRSCGGNSVTVGKSELEQILKQMTFTRSESHHFISLMHSRTIEEESPTPFLRVEASSTSGSVKRHKHGDERDDFHASDSSSRVLDEALRRDLKLINNNSTCLSITSEASPQPPATIENLPEELLSNIFLRLLAKQLAQMRSVSKSWNALLSHSYFIKSHLHDSTHNKDQVLLVFYIEEFSYNLNPFTAKPSQSPSLRVNNFIKLPVNPQPEDRNGITIIGSINGLICSRYGDSIIHIWNPSLSAVLTLPPYSTPSHADNSMLTDFRFGFDPKTDDYKVVKLTGLTSFTKSREHVVEWWLQVEIYSMRKGSWELITGRFPSHMSTIIDGDYACVDGHDGHLHWVSYNYINNNIDSQSQRILAFDLNLETFREIPFPHSTLDYKRDNVLGVLYGKICVMSCITEDDACEVWVMDEYGVTELWVRRHVFSQFFGGMCLYGCTSHNEFLVKGNGCLVLYDPYANMQRVLEDHCPEERGVDRIMEYVDSLVWVAPP